MECAKAFAVAATMAVLVISLAAVSVSASDAAGNDTLEGCAGGCSTAVGIVNVTLVEGPPAITGFSIFQPFDFSAFFSAVSAMLSSGLSFLGL